MFKIIEGNNVPIHFQTISRHILLVFIIHESKLTFALALKICLCHLCAEVCFVGWELVEREKERVCVGSHTCVCMHTHAYSWVGGCMHALHKIQVIFFMWIAHGQKVTAFIVINRITVLKPCTKHEIPSFWAPNIIVQDWETCQQFLKKSQYHSTFKNEATFVSQDCHSFLISKCLLILNEGNWMFSQQVCMLEHSRFADLVVCSGRIHLDIWMFFLHAVNL
jgi:hypothetical protein